MEAASCSRRCKEKNTKEKRKRCLKQCKKTPSLPQSAQLGGVGPQITESFQLAAGRYQATANIVVTVASIGSFVPLSNFIVWVYGPQEFSDLVFNELPRGSGGFQYQGIVQLPADGFYFFNVEDIEGSWNIQFSTI